MNIKDIKIRNARSIKNDLVLTYKEKGRRKKHIIENFPWYFVMKFDEAVKYADKIKILIEGGGIERTERTEDNKYVKFYCNKEEGKRNSNAHRVIEYLEGFGAEVLEADFHSAKRFMLDTECQVSDEYDILYWDIETDDTTQQIVIGGSRILSVAAIDNQGNEFYNDDENEEELLKWTVKLFSKYDVIAGWNTHGFDMPYLTGMMEKEIDDRGIEVNKRWLPGRLELYGLKIDDKTFANIDMLARARKMFKEDAKLKSYSLESVSQHFLGKGKVKRTGRVIDLYTNDRETFKKYNLTDVYLLKELDEKTGMIELIAKQCAMTRTLIREFAGLYISKPLDNFIIEYAHKKGIYVPSKRAKYKGDVQAEVDLAATDESYAGGYVYDPEVGLHENVYVFDFKSLYPSIIVASNIGFDTLIKKPEGNYLVNPGTENMFTKDRMSVVAETVDMLVEERQVYKKKRLKLIGEGKMKTEEFETVKAAEIIVKEMANSMYGVLGNKYSRWYSVETAESITRMGQYLLKWTYNWFNMNGWKSIYGDTDSVFVIPKHPNRVDLEKLMAKYHKEIHAHLKEEWNIEGDKIYLKYEKLFSSLLMLKKKYYVGYVTNIEGEEVNEFIAKGVDLVKKATPPVALKAQRAVVDMVLSGQNEDTINQYVEEYKQHILTDKFEFDEIKTTRNINKGLDDYKERSQSQPHVIIAKRMIERNGFLESREIEYVYYSHKEKIIHERHEFTGEFDRNLLWNNAILAPILRILDAAYPGVDWEANFKIKAPPRIKKSKVVEGQQTLF